MTATNTTDGCLNHVHQRTDIEASNITIANSAVGANQAAARTNKHERISLKKLHSLRNQLFCGFKSFSSSSEQSRLEQSPSKASSTATKLTKRKISGAKELNDSGKSFQEVQDADQQPSNIDPNNIMIVDRGNTNSTTSSGCLSRNNRQDCRSSTWNSQVKEKKLVSNNQESTQLLCNDSNEEDSCSLRVSDAGQHGCSSKRASFRRLTGRSSRKHSATDDQPEKMMKLIKLLDRFSKSLCDNEHDDQELCPEANVTNEKGDVFYLEKSWTAFVRLNLNEGESSAADSDSDSKQSARNNLKVQQDAIWELLTSEVFYLKRLRVIMNVFLETLTKLQQNSLLLEIDPAKLTSNIEEIYLANYTLWSNNLLPMLMKSRHSGCPLDPVVMKDTFIRISDLFGCYNRYCLEHIACLNYLRDESKSDQYFKVYLAWCESQKDCERLRLMDLLAKPMQRLTKYPLLLKAIYRRANNSNQLEDLRQMIIGVENFVLTVDLRLRERDELEQLRTTADRVELLEIGSGDNYCDEVNKIIMQYNSSFYLYKPLFDCPFGCNRRLIFDSSQQTMNNLGQFKFKDSMSSSKFDVVILLFTDQLLICKQIANRWYANASASQNAQESSPISSLKSSVYGRNFNSSRHRNSTKSNSQSAGWSKSRSGSGNHLVDSLILADDHSARSDIQDKTGRLLSAHNSGCSDQQTASFHLSTSSLAGTVAREHFIISKSAEHSRSGENFAQTPNKSPSGSQLSRLKAIRAPYPIDRLVVHELNDGHRVFCCQLNDSNTIAASFILQIGSTTSSETLKNTTKGDNINTNFLKQAPTTTFDSSRLEQSDSNVMHHLSPLAGFSKFRKTNQQQIKQISPAKKLIDLIEQTKLRYKSALNFHKIPTTPMNIQCKIRLENINSSEQSNVFSNGIVRLDPSSTSARARSISRSSELLELGNLYLGERQTVAKDENTLDVVLQESDMMKSVLEQEQSMLLKHEKYDELQACKLEYMLGGRYLPSNTGNFENPLSSVSIDDTKSLNVPKTISKSSVFEAEANKDTGLKDGICHTDSELQDTQAPTEDIYLAYRARGKSELKSDDAPTKSKTCGIQLNTSSSEAYSELTSDQRQGDSWSCSGSRKPLTSISGSDIDSTVSDVSQSVGKCLSFEPDSSKVCQQKRSLNQYGNHRRQVNHLRRQNDIISLSHDQQEVYSGGSLQFYSQAFDEPPSSSASIEARNNYQLDNNSFMSNNLNSVSPNSSLQMDDLEPITSLSQQNRKYKSIARHLMHEQYSSSQNTMDQTSITLNDNQLDSLDLSEETRTNSRTISIESGNLRARSSFCANGHATSPVRDDNRTVNCEKTRQIPRDKHSHIKFGVKDRESRLMDMSLDKSENLSKIPSESEQVCVGDMEDRSSSGWAQNIGVECIKSCGSPTDADDKNSLAENQAINSSSTNRVHDVPLLNITSADSHSIRRDLEEDFNCQTLANNQTEIRSQMYPMYPVSKSLTDRSVQSLGLLIDKRCPSSNRHDQLILKTSRSVQSNGVSLDDGKCLLRTTDETEDGRNMSFDSYSGRYIGRSRDNCSFDEDWASSNYKGNLLELKCIHKLIHQQEESQDSACGKVYLGFYEKLDLHLKQTSNVVSIDRSAPEQTNDREYRQVDSRTIKASKKVSSGRHSPARSDSSTNRRVKSLRMLTNDLIGSILRATSSCSIHSRH